MTGKTCLRCSSNSHRRPPPKDPSHPPSPYLKRTCESIFATVVLGCILASAPLAPSQDIEYRTLPQLIEAGSNSLHRQQFPQAAHAFNAILENYSEEPVWTNGQLPAKILPLAGFASHKAHLHSQAIAALELFLDSYAEDPNSKLFATYTLASSQFLDGQEQAARQTFAQLREIAGHTPFRDLAILRQASLSQPPVATELLSQLLEHPASPRLASLARLKLVQLHLEQNDTANASAQLLDTPWQHSQLPELAALANLAIRVGDALLSEKPARALQAYQLVPPKPTLVSAQQTRIADLQATYQQRAPTLNAEQSMWADQFRQSLATLQKQLAQLQEAPDYSDAVDLRKARCFSQINRPLEAWILAEPIANSDRPLARQAHLDWISIARQFQAWNASALIAQEFLNKYPNDKHAPQTLLWIALSQIEQTHYQAALASLEKVQQTATAPQLLAAAHYHQAYCLFQLNQIAKAAAAFQAASDVDPSLPIAAQAQLWIGICQFTTNQLDAAIQTFAQIESNPAHPYLHPEAAYRQTAAHYALGDHKRAIDKIQAWLGAYPSHPREAEVQLLQGDILYERARPQDALAAYASVESHDPELTFLALQKQAHILLETQQPKRALDKLETFKNLHPIPLPYIGSFTQLLADTLLANNQQTTAQHEIQTAIQSHGNSLQASGILPLVQRLPIRPYDYQTALDNNQATLASRYLVALIQNLHRQGHTSQAKLKALALASQFELAELPPEALVQAGNALAEIQSLQTPAYFEATLEKYPSSNYTEDALLGLARYHASLDQPQQAIDFLNQTSLDTPASLSLRIELESTLGQTAKAQTACESLLALRQATPTQKAKALLALGQIALDQNQPTIAYTYFQRIFTLYRGETEPVGQAYLACAQILSSDSRYSDAQSVAQEFLSQPDLLTHPARTQAETLLSQLERHTQPTP